MTLVDQFLEWLECERRYSPLTVRNYRHDVDEFLSWCGTTREEFEPHRIKREDVVDWSIHLLEERKLKSASVNRAVASLRTLWRWMATRGYVDANITKVISQLKTPKRLPSFVPESRMEEVLATMRDDLASDDFLRVRNVVIVLLIYTAGLRLSELVGANVEDLAPDYSSLRVVGKGNKVRVQPLIEGMAPILKKYFSQFSLQNICIGQKKPLILSQKGRRISQRTVERIVDGVLRSAGVQGKTSPHVLRHTFATHLLNRGSDLREIQELLGHSSLVATQVYTHTNIEQLREVYAAAHPRGSEQAPPPTEEA